MKNIFILIVTFMGITCFISCKSRAKETFDYIPIEDYKYDEEKIQHGAEVQLLAFSGGEEGPKESAYYYQFLVIDKTTGDTFRILAPLISVDKVAGLDRKTYETPLQYNPEKGVTKAYFEVEDSMLNFVLSADKLTETMQEGEPYNISELMSKLEKKKFIVVNKRMAEFNSSHYRAAKGVLNFMEIPW